jgi:hypothetical protein
MHTALPLSIVVLISLALIVIGFFYIAAPEKVVGSFGLKPPEAGANTQAWLHLKGIRDVTCGLAVLILMLTTNNRTVGILFLVFAAIPLGDMSNILVSGGRKATAFSVHGMTCLAMLFAGLLLIHAF